MNLKGKKVLLRSIENEDIEILRELINDPWYESMIVGWAFPISKRDQEEWFKNYKISDKQLRLIIETEEDGMVGMTGLMEIDWKNGVAQAGGMRIAKKDLRTKGIATDAYMTLFKYAFEELRLNRIEGSVLTYNIASIKTTQKVGFKQEGIKREAIYKNGEYHDVISLGILKKDYLVKKKELGYEVEE